MKNAWLGYLSSALLFIAGIIMLVAGKWIGLLFVLLALAGLVIRIYLNKKV